MRKYPALAHGWYAAGVAVLFHLRVVLFEEPWLARTFPEAWTAYAVAVPRWLWIRDSGQRPS